MMNEKEFDKMIKLSKGEKITIVLAIILWILLLIDVVASNNLTCIITFFLITNLMIDKYFGMKQSKLDEALNKIQEEFVSSTIKFSKEVIEINIKQEETIDKMAGALFLARNLTYVDNKQYETTKKEIIKEFTEE